MLATGGRVHPALSPDGTRLACLDMSGNLLYGTWRDRRGEGAGQQPPAAAGCPAGPAGRPTAGTSAVSYRNRLNQRFREGYNLIRVDRHRRRHGRPHAVAPHASISDRYGTRPVWSPDGRHLAVVVESALWLLPVRADGTPDGEPRTFTAEAADHPTWSGDSRHAPLPLGGRRSGS